MLNTCPKCRAGETQSFPAIWMNGSSSTTVHGTQGFSQTVLARMANPPARSSLGSRFFFGLILGAILVIGVIACFGQFDFTNPLLERAAIIWIQMVPTAALQPSAEFLKALVAVMAGAAGVIVGILNLFPGIRYNAVTYPRLYAEWQNTWYCHRCTNTFFADSALSRAA